MDRGFAFRLVSIYLNTFRADDPRALYELKFQFLQLVCFHEHYVPLNFPSAINWIALRCLRDLLAKHELDDRYQNKVLYCPLCKMQQL